MARRKIDATLKSSQLFVDNVCNLRHHGRRDLNISNFKQPASQSPIEYAQAIWTKALLGSFVYKDYRLQ